MQENWQLHFTYYFFLKKTKQQQKKREDTSAAFASYRHVLHLWIQSQQKLYLKITRLPNTQQIFSYFTCAIPILLSFFFFVHSVAHLFVTDSTMSGMWRAPLIPVWQSGNTSHRPIASERERERERERRRKCLSLT